MGEFNNEKFPVYALKPKSETAAKQFLEKYPLYDGTDITIAILDSGVDPSVSDLQVREFFCRHTMHFSLSHGH